MNINNELPNNKAQFDWASKCYTLKNSILKKLRKSKIKPDNTLINTAYNRHGCPGKRSMFFTPVDISIDYFRALAELPSLPDFKLFVPKIVQACAQYLLSNARNIQGIFRVCGSARRIKELQIEMIELSSKDSINNIYNADFEYEDLFDKYSIHDVAGVFMRYLNTLKEHVIPSKYYYKIRTIYNESNMELRIKKIKEVLIGIKSANQYLLLYLLDFLYTFGQYSEQTKMPISNLAKVFQPSIYNHNDHIMVPDEYKKSCEILEFMIVNYVKISPFSNSVKSISDITNFSSTPSTGMFSYIDRKHTSNSEIFNPNKTAKLNQINIKSGLNIPALLHDENGFSKNTKSPKKGHKQYKSVNFIEEQASSIKIE